ncbi:MAG: hypothetical protein ACRETT_03785, partial [Steroidobacteraceae bacterium]
MKIAEFTVSQRASTNNVRRLRSNGALASLLFTIAIGTATAAGAACNDSSLRSAELVIAEAAPIRFKNDIARRASAR